MHKINRIDTPKSLVDNGAQWTRELLEEIESKEGYKNVDDDFKNKYKQTDVLTALEKMTDGHNYCFYCESHLGITDYQHIEHYKPKSNPNFHNLIFDWNNLHLSCEKCNKKKGTKWDSDNPMIDPCEDNINDHLTYRAYTLEGKTERGRTTINHLLLNDYTVRKGLINARMRVFIAVVEIIQKINDTTDPVEKENNIDKLKMFRHENQYYKGMIEHTINSLLRRPDDGKKMANKPLTRRGADFFWLI